MRVYNTIFLGCNFVHTARYSLDETSTSDELLNGVNIEDLELPCMTLNLKP